MREGAGNEISTSALLRVAQLFSRLQLLALVALPVLGVLLAASGDGGWRLGVIGGAMVASATLRFVGHPSLERRAVSLFVLHGALISVTGGVESPMLPVVVPVVIVLAVAAGRGRAFAASAAFLGLLVTTLLILRWWDLDALAVPSLLRAGAPPALDKTYLGLTALFIIVFMVVGGSIGLLVRGDLDAAARGLVAARAETLAELTDRNRELAALSSTLAHELKNPLAAIQSLSDLVARKLGPESRERDQMRVLIGEVHRLGGILDAFLNLSRPVEGLNTVEVAPATILQGVHRLYEATAARRKIRLSLDAVAEPRVRCDPRKIRQVLVNLVENAMRAAPDGSEVRLSARAVEGGISLAVRDAGPGLPAVPVERLLQSGVTTHPEGTGLGLTIAQAIVAQHGGELTLVDNPDGGAEARVFLPIEAA